MRPYSTLLAVAASSAGLFLACGGGLGSPADNLLGSDPLPNSGEHPGSSTDPVGSSTDPTGGGSCVCPAGRWDCGQIDLSIELKNGVCVGGKTTIDPCTGRFSTPEVSGTVRIKGGGLELCLGNQCLQCTPRGEPGDASIPDTSVKDGATDAPKDAPVDAPKDVAKDAPAQVCTNFCSTNSECQSTCPAAPNGLLNCCDPNANACYLDTACP